MSESDPIGIQPSEDESSDRSVPHIPSMDPQHPGIDDLTERFSQQQVMISQLKEMVIAEEAARTQKIANTRLKMEKCATQLARIRDRAKLTKLKNAPDTPPAVRIQETSEPGVSHEEHLVISSGVTVSAESPNISYIDISTPTASPTVPSLPQKPELVLRPKSKTPSREVTKILHQQIKEHKAMIAERAKTEKELEQALAKIQKQLEDGQQQSVEHSQAKVKVDIPTVCLVDSGESNKLVIELKNKIIQLESTILDLQETCKEKDSVIDSKTKAITLMSADLSKKGKNTLDLLDDTKEQMQQMQENFAIMESNMKLEKQQLSDELQVSKNRISYLEEANSILEGERFNLSVENSNLEESLAAKEADLNLLKSEIIENLQQIDHLKLELDKSMQSTTFEIGEEKGIVEVSEMNELTDKIEILEKLNLVLRQSNIELEERLTSIPTPEKESSPSKKHPQEDTKSTKKVTKPVPKGKGAQRYKSLPPSKSENQPKSGEEKDLSKDFQETIKTLELVVQSLNKQILDKEVLLSSKDTENQLLKESLLAAEDTIRNNAGLKEMAEKECSTVELLADSNIAEVQEDIITPSVIETVDTCIEDSSIKSEQNAELASIKIKLDETLNQIEDLTKELADANKNMVKVKSSHKAKIKQMQKSIDDFSKVSDTNTEVVRLQGEVSLLTQRVAELEEDKGNLQLHLVDYDSGRVSDSQLHAKLLEIEGIAEDRLKAITDLETQKFDLVQELHSVRQQISVLEDKVSDLTFFENEHVSTEIKSVQLEEQIDQLKSEHAKIVQETADLRTARDELFSNVESLQKEKSEISNKLDYYIQENIDLMDRLDKLNAEKVSSAESIEMVESLTSQEKMEIEQYNKTFDSPHEDEKEAAVVSGICEEPARRDSFSHSNYENMELSTKIEHCMDVAHEDKIDNLKAENETLRINLDALTKDKSILEENNGLLKKERDDVISTLKEETAKIESMSQRIENLTAEKQTIADQLKQLMEQRSIRTEEVILSETVEVKDVIETEITKSPTQSLESEPLVEDKKIVNVSSKSAVQTTDKASKMSTLKSNKNATKEILRLKNLLKHQESEMSNLKAQLANVEELKSEKEHLTKQQSELESNLQKVIGDNTILNNQILGIKEEKEAFNQQVISLQKYNEELLQEQLNILQVKDTAGKNSHEDELKLKEEIIIRNNSLLDEQVITIATLNEDIVNKDREITECLEQIEKMNVVNNKLKSAITQYEEEKSSSIQHVDIIRNLESNIAQLQGIINQHNSQVSELETKIEESNDFANLMRQQLSDLQKEIRETNEMLNETKKEMILIIKQRDDNQKEISKLQLECTSKDEEIHEIKLQLRKESIEYDQLKSSVKNIESDKQLLQTQFLELNAKCSEYETNISKHREEYSLLDNKYKEQFEKLKKFAANFKKKATLCTELEAKIDDLNKNLETQVKISEEANLQTQMMHQQLSLLNTEYSQVKAEVQQASYTYETANILQTQISQLQNDLMAAQTYNEELHSSVAQSKSQNEKLIHEIDFLKTNNTEFESKLHNLTVENMHYSDRVGEYEKQLENSKTVLAKITDLEKEINDKQLEVTSLLEKLEDVQATYDKYKCGHEAKIQERDVYIESLQAELIKHKDRILRLEDSVSTMEERRSSLERKADCLVSKLNEKDKACSESSFHEDALEKRLTALIVHDELIQKQLLETENENIELNETVHRLSESKKCLQSEFDACRSDLLKLKDELAHLQSMEEERHLEHERVSYLENELKRVGMEYAEMMKTKASEYEFLENELHTQVKNTELQRRMSIEQHEKLQDEMIIQVQALKELQSECDWLKAENENLHHQLNESSKASSIADISMHDFASKETSRIELSNLQSELFDLSLIVKQKDAEIQKYQQHTLQLQMALSDNQASQLSSATDTDKEKSVEYLESLLYQKEQEIVTLKHQFESCYLQLTEVVDAEKILQSSCIQMNKSLEEKDSFIGKLQGELLQLHGQYQQLVSASKDSAESVEPVQEQTLKTHTTKQLFGEVPNIRADKSQNKDDIFDAIALKAIEDQIISIDDTDKSNVIDGTESMIRAFQHDLPEQVVLTNIESKKPQEGPVNEDVIKPKATYLCFEDKESGQSEFFGENVFTEDEGWGWSSQDAQLEEEHLQSQVSQNMETPTQCKITELESTIKFMTEENNKLSTELVQSQQKTSKALKKLKEFKHKHDLLSNDLNKLKTSSEVNMLDIAIQDELSEQIKSLEDKMKEMAAGIQKEKVEKEGLLKRIDVLTSANERLMEMKEKQDVEMGICVSKNKDLNDKLKNLEWGDDFQEEHTTPIHMETVTNVMPVSDNTSQMIDDLNKKIKDIEADNEELQAILDEHTVDNDILKRQHKELKLSMDVLMEVKNQQDEKLAALEKSNEEYKSNLINSASVSEVNESYKVENVDLKTKLADLVNEYYEFQQKYNEIATEKDKIDLEHDSLRKEKDELEWRHKDVCEREVACKAELIKMEYEKEEAVERCDQLIKKLAEKNEQNDSEQLISLADQLQMYTQELDLKNAELISLTQERNTVLDEKALLQQNIEKSNEENAVLLSSLTELRNNVTEAIDQRGTEVAEMWKQHLAMREAEFETLEKTLQQQICNLESKLPTPKMLSSDIIDQDQISSQVLVAEVNTDDYIKQLKEIKKELDEVTADKEKYKQLCETELPEALQKCETLSLENAVKLKSLEEKELEVQSLNAVLANLQATSAEHLSKSGETTDLQLIIQSKDEELQRCIALLQEMEYNFNLKMTEYNTLLSHKDSELCLKSQENLTMLQKLDDCENLRQQVNSLEIQLTDANHDCEAELAGMRLKMHDERISYERKISDGKDQVKILETHLESKNNEIRGMNKRISELEALLEEENIQISELRTVLENQELEIVTLKENLTAHADEYDRVVQQHMHEKSRLRAERHVSFAEDTKPGADVNEDRSSLMTSANKPDSLPRADLDLALYMLHQRDVRCEELTVELMQLLEERDTLQLKLSNAIRANEEMRSKRSPSQGKAVEGQIDFDIETSPSSSFTAETQQLERLQPEVGIELTADLSQCDEDPPLDHRALETKISQLHTVGHTRDVTLRDEREVRQRQMELLHRDVQHLPPEAAARLREAHYTLTRDTQSASTVLMNWLWGRTTPKVVHM